MTHIVDAQPSTGSPKSNLRTIMKLVKNNAIINNKQLKTEEIIKGFEDLVNQHPL
jgi:hypothetical protein